MFHNLILEFPNYSGGEYECTIIKLYLLLLFLILKIPELYILICLKYFRPKLRVDLYIYIYMLYFIILLLDQAQEVQLSPNMVIFELMIDCLKKPYC